MKRLTLSIASRMQAVALAALLAAASSFTACKPKPTEPEAPRTTQAEQPAKNGEKSHAVLDSTAKAFNKIAASSVDSVVSISALKSAPHGKHGMMPMPGGMPGISPNTPDTESPHGGAGPFGPDDEDSQDRFSMGLGSGVVIRSDGLIMTNNHVVENATRVTVAFDDKHKTKALVVGSDPKTDLAVIKIVPPESSKATGKLLDPDEIPPAKLKPIEFGDSDSLQVGDSVLAIGSPYGLNRSVTSGIVSAKGRGQMGILDVEDFIQTDAAINPGNSGGPLLNSAGKMIGLNTAIFSENGAFAGIGFAIPSKIAKEVSDELIKNGKVTRGWLGVGAQDLEPSLANFFGVKGETRKGAIISEVLPKGPGGQADLHAGDVVLSFGDTRIESADQLKSIVGKSKIGARVPIHLIRNGQELTLNANIREQPAPPRPLASVQQAGQKGGDIPPEQKKPPQLGLTVENIPPEIGALLGVAPNTGALVVGVRPGSPAFDSGISPGDIIRRANKTEIRNARTLAETLKKLNPDETAVLYIQRGREGKAFVPVKPG